MKAFKLNPKNKQNQISLEYLRGASELLQQLHSHIAGATAFGITKIDAIDLLDCIQETSEDITRHYKTVLKELNNGRTSSDNASE